MNWLDFGWDPPNVKGIPEKDLSKLQTVQKLCCKTNIECAKRRDPVTPMLTTRLHWLPVEKRIVYKIVLLCHKVLIHKSPTYLASVLTPYLPQQNLRSSSKQLLVVPTSSTCTYGDHAFASAAPILWNKLPDNLKTETDTSSFIKSLKTLSLFNVVVWNLCTVHRAPPGLLCAI